MDPSKLCRALQLYSVQLSVLLGRCYPDTGSNILLYCLLKAQEQQHAASIPLFLCSDLSAHCMRLDTCWRPTHTRRLPVLPAHLHRPPSQVDG
jgi:hypothetical protein